MPYPESAQVVLDAPAPLFSPGFRRLLTCRRTLGSYKINLLEPCQFASSATALAL